jgi:hypothetical protein
VHSENGDRNFCLFFVTSCFLSLLPFVFPSRPLLMNQVVLSCPWWPLVFSLQLNAIVHLIMPLSKVVTVIVSTVDFVSASSSRACLPRSIHCSYSLRFGGVFM